MIDYEKADLAIVKALSKAALTLEEIEQILDADRKYFSVEQGLIQSQVSNITQSNSGELWIATKGGVSSFNGFDFPCCCSTTTAIDKYSN